MQFAPRRHPSDIPALTVGEHVGGRVSREEGALSFVIGGENKSFYEFRLIEETKSRTVLQSLNPRRVAR
jgi:hypothetical protein